jgi:hypothetical protein
MTYERLLHWYLLYCCTGIYVYHTRSYCRNISVILLHRYLRMPYARLLQRYLFYTAAQASTYAVLVALQRCLCYPAANVSIYALRNSFADLSLIYWCTGIYVFHTRGCFRDISVILLHRHLHMPQEMVLRRWFCYAAAQASTYAILEAVAEVSLLYCCTGI